MRAGNLLNSLNFAFATFKLWQQIEFKWPERLAGLANFGRELVPNKWYHPLVGLSDSGQAR